MTLSAPPAAAVSRFPSQHFNEGDLARLWQGQRFPPEALRTREGRAFRVIYRGRATGGPGPDYRDAIISAAEELLQGDVELHVRTSDFRRHGHHRDPAYDRLVLHLVFRHDEDGETQLAGGRRVPVVALADWVEGRAQEIRSWLERPTAWQEPCAGAVGRMGADAAGAALERLGDIRFGQKAAAFARRVEGIAKEQRRTPAASAADVDRALWEALLEGLGYGGERETMRALAERLPWAALQSRLARTPARRRAQAAAALLLEALAEERRRPLAPGAPASSPPRPLNRVETRLRGAAALAARFTVCGPLASLAPHLQRPAEVRLAGAIQALTVAGAVGRGRALELLANAVLPAFAAAGDGEAAEALYRRLPLPASYGPVKHIRRALGGEVQLDMRRQQGMLYLLKNYCSQGGCGRCALS